MLTRFDVRSLGHQDQHGPYNHPDLPESLKGHPPNPKGLVLHHQITPVYAPVVVMTSLRVLICGAGIAGPALAFWLSKIGCAVTVIERTSTARHVGQQIDIRAQGVTVMRRMGIEAAVRARVVDERGTQIVDRNGKRKAFFAANKSGKGRQTISSEFEIMRRDLSVILFDITKDKTKYVYGIRVQSFEQLGGDKGVYVKFSDGTEDIFDLVVGADGQNSELRKLLLGPDTPDPFYPSGTLMAWVTIPSVEGDPDTFTGCIAPGRRAIGTRVGRPGCQQLYLMAVADDLPEGHPLKATLKNGSTVASQKKAWADYFEDAGWEASRFTRDMVSSPLADDWHACDVGQVRMDSWFKGRVALVGDAGFCPSPATGMGTACAFVGAYVLAGEIARTCGLTAEGNADDVDVEKARQRVPAALQAYDQRLRPFITKVHKRAHRGKLPSSALGISFWYFALSCIETLKLDKIASRMLPDDVIGWNLPEYPELGTSR